MFLEWAGVSIGLVVISFTEAMLPCRIYYVLVYHILISWLYLADFVGSSLLILYLPNEPSLPGKEKSLPDPLLPLDKSRRSGLDEDLLLMFPLE